MTTPNIYRSRILNEISESDVGKTIRVAGWVENIRDHGGVSFVDLRDMYGVLQVVLRDTSLLDGITKENCISIEGVIDHRDEDTYNPKIPTGTIELEAHSIDMLGKVYHQLPFEIMTSREIREDVRLKYRYLDLRNQKVKDNIIFRSQVISFLRQKMTEMGFLEIQTPILCASSPEGARDYIVPSRKFKGRFYALPQAPQQYKQLLMVSGFDKYFQIAPCFRDEDARADRSPGEFYQLDFEMSFATQEEVFRVGEEVLTATFEKFAPEGASVTAAPYPVISYKIQRHISFFHNRAILHLQSARHLIYSKYRYLWKIYYRCKSFYSVHPQICYGECSPADVIIFELHHSRTLYYALRFCT